MKYYLLTFNEDFADEIDIPALQCFDENNYNEWLELPCGKFRSEEEIKVSQERYELYLKEQDEFNQKCEDTLGKNWRLIYYKEWPQSLKDKERNFNLKWPYYSRSMPIVLTRCYIRDYLGNWGDGFNEIFYCYKYMKDLVKNKLVAVSEVSKEFYDTFHKNKLSSLSLCSIFNVDEIKEYRDEDEN